MSLNDDYVTEKLGEQPFQIINMEQDPESGNMVLTVIHEIHPDIEVSVSLISKTEDGEDTMELQFDGPEDYTDEEAKQVLQEVMNTLVTIIESSVEDNPEPVESPEDPEGTEGETDA